MILPRNCRWPNRWCVLPPLAPYTMVFVASVVLGVAPLARCLQAQGPPPMQLGGHTAPVNSAVYTPDHRHVITAGADQTIRIWNAATGKPIRMLSGHTGQVMSVASSPDSLVLVSGAADNSIRMWDVPRTDPLRIFAGQISPVRDVAVSIDGKWAVSFAEDLTGRVWKLEDGSPGMLLKGLNVKPVSTAFRNDGNQIAAGDEAGRISTWETLEGELDGAIEGHQGAIRRLIFHPNNQQLVSAGADGLLKVWQLPLAASRQLSGHTASVRCVVLTNNGQLSITGSDTEIRIHQLASGQPVRELADAVGPTHALAASPNNLVAAAAGPLGVVKLWNINDGADRLKLAGHTGPVRALSFHPDNARLASAGEDGTIRLWRLPTPPVAMAGHTAELNSLAVSVNGLAAASASSDKTVRVWNPQTGQAVRTLSGHADALSSVKIRADNAQIASGDNAGEVRFWNLADGAPQGVLGAHQGPLRGIAYAPSGKQMATVGEDGLLKIWALPLTPALTLAGNAAEVTDAAVSSDGKWVVTAGADKSIRIYDAATAQQTRTLADVPDAVSSLALSQDDSLITAGTIDGVIKIWTAATGAPWAGPAPAVAGALPAPAVLTGHEGGVTGLVFDPQAKRIVSAGADGTIRVWSLPAAPQLAPELAGVSSRFVVSRNGKLSATAGVFEGQPAIILRDLSAGGRIVQRLLGHKAAITALAFQKGAARMISGGADGTCLVWNLANKKFPEIQSLKLPAAVSAVALSDDGGQLFAASGNGIGQYTVVDGKEVRQLSGHSATISSLEVAGPNLVSAAADSSVRVWTIATGAPGGQLNHGAAVTNLAVSSDGKSIASCGADNLIKVWNISGGTAKATLKGHVAPIIGAAFSADGSRLASAGNDGLSLWDLAASRRLESIALAPAEPRGLGFAEQKIVIEDATGALRLLTPQIQTLIEAHPGGASTLDITADGNRVVSAGADKTLKLWNVADGKLWATFAGPSDVVQAACLTADGKRLLAGGKDKSLRLWTLPPAAIAQPVAATKQWEFEAPILELDVSADGNRVAVAGDDMQVRIWDLELERELERITGHAAPIARALFTSDGSRVVTCSADKSARIAKLALLQRAALSEAKNNPTLDVAYLADGKQVVVAGVGNGLSRWTVGADNALAPAAALPIANAAPTGYVAAKQVRLAVRNDGGQLASLDATGRINVWSLPDAKLKYVLPPAKATVVAKAPAAPVPGAVKSPALIGQLVYSQDGAKLAVGQGQVVRMHDAESGMLLQRWDESAPVGALGVTPKGAKLIIGRSGAANNLSLREFALERLIESKHGVVRSLAFTADGNGLLSGGDDKLLRLWATADGKLTRSYSGCLDRVNSVAFSRDGAKVIAGSADKTVRIWPLAPMAGQPPSETLTPSSTWSLPAAVLGLSVSADNQKLAVAAADKLIRVLDLAEGHQLQRFIGHEQEALGVAIAADNKTLVSVSEKSVRADSLSLLRAIAASSESLNDLALANAGAQAVTAGSDGVKHWNLANGALLRSFEIAPPAKPAVAGAAPSPAPAATTAAKANAAPEPPPRTEVMTLSVRSDNAQVAAVDAKQQLVIWNLANGQVLTQSQAPCGVRKLRYSPDNLKLAALGEDNHLRFYNPADGLLTFELTSDKPLLGAAFTLDSRTVLTGGEQLRQWRYASPTSVRTMAGHGGAVLGLTFSPSGRWIASASADRTVRIWDAKTGAQVKQLTGHQGAAYSVAFSPDESILVSCGDEKGLRVWDVLGGRQLKQIPVGEASIYSVAFLDGKRLAAAGIERKIFMLDVFTGVLQNTLEKHPDYLYRVSLNSNGTRLLSCGYGGNIMLWNAANGQLLFETNIGQVANYADFSPDGQRIVVAGGDGKAHFVDIPTNVR